MKPGPRPVPPKKRFWRYVKRSRRGCWIWTGGTFENGYGQFGLTGKAHCKAHRFAYKLYHGRIPKRKKILHTCDVKLCVRRSHLYPGTNAKNTKDMMARGRGRWGGAGIPKLSIRQRGSLIRKISNGMSNRSLAKLFRVSTSSVQYWRRVTVGGKA